MREELEQLLEIIGRAERNPENALLFQKAVSRTLELKVVTWIDTAIGLSISLSTVNRWCMGFSAPHPLGRSSVLKWLKEKTEEKLKQ